MENVSRNTLNVVLVEPEIPNNTGSVGRLCVGFECHLHLIEPLGFELSDSRLKRAGLDYWPHLNWKVYGNLEECLEQMEAGQNAYFFSSKAQSSYLKASFRPGDWIIFGCESKGLAQDILERYKQDLVSIPFTGKVRSFNLSNAVAMALGEGMRQLNSIKNLD